MITFVCIFNSIEQLSKMLLPSLGVSISCFPGIDFSPNGLITCRNGNLLLIDNRGKDYKSAAEAFNFELSIHQEDLNDILVFCHQDIVFGSDSFAKAITKHLAVSPGNILGVAGMPKAGRTVSNLRYYRTKQFITLTQLENENVVESLDECCFAMHKGLFFQLLFNEYICNHWHLYAVELCYRARVLKNAECIVLPVKDVYHKMDDKGGLYADSHYLSSMCRLAWTYRKHFPTIYSPCCIVSTSPLSMMYRLCKTLLGNIFKKHHG